MAVENHLLVRFIVVVFIVPSFVDVISQVFLCQLSLSNVIAFLTALYNLWSEQDDVKQWRCWQFGEEAVGGKREVGDVSLILDAEGARQDVRGEQVLQTTRPRKLSPFTIA